MVALNEHPPVAVERADAAARLFFNAVAFQALFGPDLARERTVAEAVEVVLAGA